MDSLQHVLTALNQGDYQVTLHARQRMAQRNVTHENIRSCGSNGKSTQEQDGKIRVEGNDCDGVELTLICVDENGVLIITVF